MSGPARGRGLAVVVVLLAAGALVLALSEWGGDARPDAAAEGAPAVAAPAPQVAANLVAPGVSDAVPQRSAVPEPAALDAVETAPPASPAPDDVPLRNRIEARVVVVELDGTERRDADGSLRVALLEFYEEEDDVAEFIEGDIPFRDGRLAWGYDARIGDPLLFYGVCDGREGRLEGGPVELMPLIEAGEPFELRLLVEPAHRLVVRDAATGADLEQVSILVGAHPNQARPEARPQIDYDSHWMVQDARSPVTLDRALDASDGGRVLQAFVCAEAYAWRFVEVDLDRVEQVVELEPGGTIAVELTTVHDPFEAALRLYPAGGGYPDQELTVQVPGAVTLEHVRRGSYDVRVEQGGWWDGPHVLGAGSCAVVGDAVVELSLDVAAPRDERPRVDVPVALTLAAEWEESRVEGGLYPLDDADDLESCWYWEETEPHGDGRRAEFVIERVLPGEYYFTVQSIGWTQRVTVAEGAPLTIDVGAGQPLDIVVTDAVSGAPVDAQRVDVGFAAEGLDVAATREARRTGPGRFRAAVLPGPVDVTVDGGPGWSWHLERRTIDPGVGEVHVALPRPHGLRVHFRDDGGPVAFPRLARVRVAAVDHAGRLRDQVTGAEARTFYFDAPGAYRVTFGELDGYEALDPIDVEVPAGATVEQLVGLVRRP